MSDLCKRKSARLKNYDYSTPGAYFVTICAYKRKEIFSQIVGAIHESPLHSRHSVLSNVVGYLKMNASKQIHLMSPETVAWQRSYHDHIIRGEADYKKIWEYINSNVIQWEKDCFYCK